MKVDDCLVDDIVRYETEQEWLEFKENWFEPSQLGEYVSAFSSVADALDRFVPEFALLGVLTS
ncbi:MAG: hypothetical protein J6D54_13225, partial [Olsenella sp.]|nr:hypothetical protein [Olsenella sp.]